MIGAQASSEQLEKILSYLDIGRQEGAQCLIGGQRTHLEGDLKDGYYVQPTAFKEAQMRIFQEEIFGPGYFRLPPSRMRTRRWPSPMTRCTRCRVWSRDMNTAFRMGRGIQAGALDELLSPSSAHAALGGYKSPVSAARTTK
jgi:aldehyde dehydrogenase